MEPTKHKQMSLFSESESECIHTRKSDKENDSPTISSRILESFSVADIPFLECDFETLYPHIASILPKESILFDNFELEVSIACETICAAICHQMNWDYLRRAVLEKTLKNKGWVSPQSLAQISAETVSVMFAGYNKPERVREEERASILRQTGELAKRFGCFTNILFDEKGCLLPEDKIRANYRSCTAFAKDPEEKKLQLLIQKLSSYNSLSELAFLCKPTVDYHLIRSFLRRGLISPKNKFAKSYIYEPSSTRTERRESTVAALRQLCSVLVLRISDYTNLSVNTVNQIEWYVGRSVCTEGTPDCYLSRVDTAWLRSNFDRCPFYSSCCAINYNPSLLNIEEPLYKGTSY